LAKLVVLFCVTTGAVLEVSIAAFKVSEWEMSRQLYARLQPEDVVVADSYGTYVDLVLVQAAKADAVFRKHHARHAIFVGAKVRNWRPYRHLAVPNDVLSRWLQMSFKRFRTPCMSEVHLLIRQSGFRPKQIILVTTLLSQTLS